jgi:hypothetical protein
MEKYELSDHDIAQLRANLALTYEERFRNAEAAARFVLLLQQAAQNAGLYASVPESFPEQS